MQSDAQKLGKLIFDPGGSGNNLSLGLFSAEELESFRQRAQLILDEPMISGNYDDRNLDLSMLHEDTKEFKKLGLRSLIESRTQRLRWPGESREVIEPLVENLAVGPALLDLMEFGVRSFVKPTFKPNGGVGYRQSKSYYENRGCCNWHMFKLRSAGKAVFVEWDALSPEEKASFNLNKLQLAPKTGKPQGRCCLNASSTIRHKGQIFESLNDGLDLDQSDAFYPPTVLPNLTDICDLAQAVQAETSTTDDIVVGATIDVAGAYNQFTLSYEAALLRGVMVYIGKAETPYVCIILVNNFGESRAGHVYNVAGAFIDHHHNSERLRSKTYIDDGILLDKSKRMEPSRADYRVPISIVFGGGGLAPEKDLFMGQDLVAIGWHLNLRSDVWRVAPKKRAIEKMYGLLFILLPENATDPNVVVKVTRRLLNKIASTLSWYSPVWKVGTAFVHSLFKNLGYGYMDEKLILSNASKLDLEWWRAIILMAMRDPHSMSAKINHLASGESCDLEITTDASSSVGGGAWQSQGDHQIQQAIDGIISFDSIEIEREGFIRWSPEELKLFDRGLITNGKSEGPISINILEFFTAIYFVMLWGPSLRGKRIRLNCDNTAAIAWLMKSRGSNKSPVAQVLVKIFVIFCVSMDITIVSRHIPGILNTKADCLSRLLSLQEKVNFRADTKTEHWWKELSREEICREFLRVSILEPSSMPLPRALELLRSLQ